MIVNSFIKRPINGSNPAGINPVELDKFDEIKRQINNWNSVTASVSWKQVQTLSREILTGQSKDFRCCCYFSVATTYNNGLRGLVEGLSALLDLCMIYWHNAYPERTKIKARIRAIEWMLDHTEKQINRYCPLPEEVKLLESAHQLSLLIEEEVRFHCGTQAPSFARMRRALKEKMETVKDNNLSPVANAIPTQIADSNTQEEMDTIPLFSPIEAEAYQEVVKTELLPRETKISRTHRAVFFSVATLFIVSLSALFTYFNFQEQRQQHQYQAFRKDIAQASMVELTHIVAIFNKQNKEHYLTLRSQVIERATTLLSNWTLNPTLVNNIGNIDKLTLKIAETYPDSPDAHQLRADFLSHLSILENEFDHIYNRFTKARRLFANIALKHSDSDSMQAYEYSHSLFPLLGSIEYAEKSTQSNDVDRALIILNAYLFKINQIKTVSTSNG